MENVIHMLGRQEHGSVRFHRGIQKGVQLQTDKLFISGIFYLISSDCSGSQVTETAEGETLAEGLPVCSFPGFPLPHLVLCLDWSFAPQGG